jgi:Transglutaminase-like superfamily
VRVRVRSLDLPTLRAAWWAHRALRRVRAELKANGLQGASATEPPALPASARRGVLGVLRRERSTCLERALVLQRWHASQGNPRDVVIAVKGPTRDFAAHAWLEGEPDGDAASFEELIRLPASR